MRKETELLQDVIQPVRKNHKPLPRAKELRREMTPQERHLWYDFLRDYPVKVYKQRIIDSFIADFYCSSAKLVIEIDGAQHFSEEGLHRDRVRTEIIERYGVQVLRFTNREVDLQFEAVCNLIMHTTETRRQAFHAAE